jgi:arginase
VTLLGPGDLDGALEGALDRLASLVDRAYLHIDLDVLDPSEGRANRYAAPDGPSLDGVLRLVRAVSSRLQVAAASLAAYDPSYDPDGRLVPAAIAIASAIVSS